MKKDKRNLWLFIVEFLAAAAIIAAGLVLQHRAEEKDAALTDAETRARRFAPSITYKEKSYPLKRNVSSVLLIGTDNFAGDSKQYEGLTYNFNLADFLVILVFDHSAKTVTPFQICRDSMCDVTMPSGKTERMQITLSHTYGTGGNDSCVITRNAVEGLLYGVPVDNYLAFTMDAVPLMNDLAGGVTVKLEDSIPELGPEYVAGAEITLHGQEALRFVRYRDTSLLDDNLRRMAHHRQYMDAFSTAARVAMSADPDYAVKCFRAAEKFLCTDLSVEQITDMVNDLCSYQLMPAITPEGVYGPGKTFPEFVVDDASLWECVRSVFCV